MTKGRSLFYAAIRLLGMAGGLLLVAMSASAELVVYPEYPAAIERDWAYDVSVTQAGETRSLVVYNHTEKSALTERTRGGDVNRRFCEFAFSGAPVRVDIRVCEDVQSYKVFPARLELETSFSNGVISVWLDTPHPFGLELNDYVKTILSVFVDKPEDPADIPSRSSADVLFVDGWMDPPGPDGTITISNQCGEVYIAPGAVLNSRLRILKPGVHVHGRGMILDPFSDIFRYDQLNNTASGVVRVGADNALVEDVKIIDARTYNYTAFADNVTFRNVKAMSSMMCSDGMTSGGRNFAMEGAWLYVGDNALVVSGLSSEGRFSDIAIGTSCKAIFPQGNNTGVRMENIDVFRCDEALIANVYNPQSTSGVERKQSFFFKNLSAVDSTLFAKFFAGANMGTLEKPFGFENLAIPHSTGSATWRSIGNSGGKTISIYDGDGTTYTTCNYTFAITNLWVAGTRSNGFSASEITRPEGVAVSVVNTLDEPEIPPVPNRHVVNWTCPWKRYVGDSLQRDTRFAVPGAGEQRLVESNLWANLLADRPATRSAWQRCPSWKARLDATLVEDGARIYRVRDCEAQAGMYNDITDAFLRRGNGDYRFSFDARVVNGPEVPLDAVLLSNEKRVTTKFTIPNDGAWHRFEAVVATDFDIAGTELVGLFMRSAVAVSEMDFRNLSFTRMLSPDVLQMVVVSDSAGYDWTNRIVTVAGVPAGAPLTLELSAPDGTALGAVSATADAAGTATFDIPVSPGSNYVYAVCLGDGVIAAGTFLAGGWDADDAWFLAVPDGHGGSIETNGYWATPPSATNATAYAVDKFAEFTLDVEAGAAGSGRLVRADCEVSFSSMEEAGGQPAAPSLGESLAAIAIAAGPEGGARWLAYVGGAWTPLVGDFAPETNTTYVMRLEGDFSLASPRVRLSVSADGGATFAILRTANGDEWLSPTGADKQTVTGIELNGGGTISGVSGAFASADVASAGGTGYASLNDALRANGPGATVTLLTNATALKSLTIGRKINCGDNDLAAVDDTTTFLLLW